MSDYQGDYFEKENTVSYIVHFYQANSVSVLKRFKNALFFGIISNRRTFYR